MKYKVTVATEDGEVLEQFTTADHPDPADQGTHWRLMQWILDDASELAGIGDNKWGED